MNIVPTSTGAARATSLVMPKMKGRLDGISLRVPIPDGSVTDFVGTLKKKATVEQINAAYAVAARKGPLAKVLDYSEEPLVSADIVGRPASCTIDAGLTMANGTLAQGLRLVRQRDGLFDTARGPDTDRRHPSHEEGPKGRTQVDTVELPELEDLGDLAGRSVLVRCDFNVPLAGGEIQDDLRIRAALPTLSYLVDAGAQVTACSHLGRPGGEPDPEFSMEPVRRRLAELAPGVGLLENLRFDPGEAGNSGTFVEALVEGHDAYVNDAFGASHRSHASVVGPPMFLPSAAGRLLAREARVLGNLREAPRRPFLAILGGAKVSDKLAVIGALLEVVDELIVGGGMCFTFLAARGASVGASLLEEDMVEECARLLDSGAPIRLPIDFTALGPGGVIGNPSAGGEVRQVGTSMPGVWMGLDIGPGSAVEFCDLIAEARTVLWNGPHGRVRGCPVRRRHPYRCRGGG